MLTLDQIAARHPELAELDSGARRLALRGLVADEALAARLSDEIDGYGLLTPYMNDPRVTDVLVNGPNEIWVEREGRLARVPESFATPSDLYRLIDRLVARADARVDASKPVADASLPDGCRLHVAIPPVAPDGPLLSIRRLDRRWDLDRLIERQMLSREEGDLLSSLVADRKTILISGGTGTGKTTLLEALLGAVPATERVLLVEETRELLPSCAHVISLVALSSNEEGTGSIGMPELLRAGLRMRPDRIVVGEVRGEEALVALGAMSTGHAGSLLTVHASSANGALDRLVMLGRQTAGGPSEALLRATVEAAIDACVHLERQGGVRRVAEVVVS